MAAISVRNVSKQFQLRESAPYWTLGETLGRLFSRAPPGSRKTPEPFWALKDVTFDVADGEVVGIIGPNGAGKSTLLKILSRITEPTEGCIDINGRVASLLEVGTGFHPELTGRENIFLNGSILGMRRAEITAKLGEIVDFSGVEKFLDMPVKRYSSGMQVRLAFAVAAHLEPEILIIDEVLAVGDAEFQRKCMGKMGAVARSGRTVLFVSHNMAAVENLCTRGILLNQGGVVFDGKINLCTEAYLQSVASGLTGTASFGPAPERPHITGVRIDGPAASAGHIAIEIDFDSPWDLNPPIGGVLVSTVSGVPVYGSNTRVHSEGYNRTRLRRGKLYFDAKNVPIGSGVYSLSIWLANWERSLDHKPGVLTFDFTHHQRTQQQMEPSQGAVKWPGTWRGEPLE